MGARIDAKDENDLILDDKLKMARTIVRGLHEQQIRRELNELESAIRKSHIEEVNHGKVLRPLWNDLEALHAGLAASPSKEIESGEDSA